MYEYRLPEEKKVFSIKHIVCTALIVNLHQSATDWGGKFLDVSQGPIVQAGPSKNSHLRPVMVTPPLPLHKK